MLIKTRQLLSISGSSTNGYPKFLFLVASFLFMCCTDPSKVPKYDYDFKHPKIIRKLRVMPGIANSNSSKIHFYISYYHHYVAVENYYQYTHCDISAAEADKYRDTCQTDLPVGALTFCRPFNFHAFGDSRDIQPLRDHSLLGFNYAPSSLADDHPTLSSVTYYYREQPYTVDLPSKADTNITVDSTNRRMIEVMKKLDAKYHTEDYNLQYGADSVVVKFKKKAGISGLRLNH